jgi:HAD superfamily hydrolase (TIGR01509 family)
MRDPALIIFDFDGVVADSELIANRALAEYLTELGKPTTLDDSMRLFMGKRRSDVVAAVEQWLGFAPDAFDERYRLRTRALMRATVEPVVGVAAFLARPRTAALCVASSSMRDWLDHCVDKFGLRGHFGDNLFSATEVVNGKPAPDIFLHAASRMACAPAATLVIEDSPAGIAGAKAAGMAAVGFLGASHIRDGHRERLLAAGADHVVEDYAALAHWLA